MDKSDESYNQVITLHKDIIQMSNSLNKQKDRINDLLKKVAAVDDMTQLLRIFFTMF